MDKKTLDLVFVEHLQQCTRDIIERCILLTRKEPEYSKMKREGVEFTCDRCGAKEFVEYCSDPIHNEKFSGRLYDKPEGWISIPKDPTNLAINISHLCPYCARKYKEMMNQFWEIAEENTCEESC